MADDLGAAGDSTFREGGALQKIAELAKRWEVRALKAERSRRAHRFERGVWLVSGWVLGAGVALAYLHR